MMTVPLIFLGGPYHGRLWDKTEDEKVFVPKINKRDTMAEGIIYDRSCLTDRLEYRRATFTFGMAFSNPIHVLIQEKDMNDLADLLFAYLIENWNASHRVDFDESYRRGSFAERPRPRDLASQRDLYESDIR